MQSSSHPLHLITADGTRFHTTEVEPRKVSLHDVDGGTGAAPTSAKPRVVLDKEQSGSSWMNLPFYDGHEPMEEDRQRLRKVADKLPWSAFLVPVIELCDSFAYYGLSGPFQNYIQNHYPDTGGIPRAIGKGQTTAIGLTSFFQFWAYITPIGGVIRLGSVLGQI